MIIDASVLLCAIFPDEAQPQAQALLYAHVAGKAPLKAPTLFIYEVSNAIWQAERRSRITPTQAREMIEAVRGLRIQFVNLNIGEMLPLARQFHLSVYDASYLSLAKQTGESFITADERLYQTVRDGFEGIIWVKELKI